MELDNYLDEITRQKSEYILPENIKQGVTIFNVDGAIDTDYTNANATADDIILGKTACVYKASLVTGTIIETTAFTDTPISSVYSGDTSVSFRNVSGKSICLRNNAALSAPNDIVCSAIRLTADILKEGESILGLTGTLKVGVDTTDADATADDIDFGKTAYVKGVKLTGTIPHFSSDIIYSADTTGGVIRTSTGLEFTKTSESKSILYDGTAFHIEAKQEDVASVIGLTSDRIKSGVSILGVAGSVDAIPSNTNKITTATTVSDNLSISTTSSNLVFNRTRSGYYTLISPDINFGYSVPNNTVANAIGLTADDIKKDVTILGVTGTYIGESGTGTEDATATADDIILGQTAYVNKVKLTGTLPQVNGLVDTSVSVSKILLDTDDKLYITTNTITKAYKSGAIKLLISQSDLAKAIGLDSSMIAEGSTVLGIVGTHTGSGMLTEEEYDEILEMANKVMPTTE